MGGWRLPALLLGVAMLASVVQAQQPVSPDSQPRPVATAIQLPNLPLGLISFPNGKAFNLNVAMGSGLFRHSADPPGRIWMTTDRGPTIDCADARRIIGPEAETMCGGQRIGRIHLLPGFAPSIYSADIGPDNVARISAFIPLKTRSGRPVSGRAPAAQNGRNEPAFGVDGRPLPADASGVDPEAIIRLADGTFWIADEFGPSLLHVAADGTVLKRLVPNGTAAEFREADYEVQAVLPAITRLRANNRGFESLAISPDERFLYAMMQSPLANPDVETFRRSRHLRLWKIDRQTGQTVAQHLYQIDEPRAFGSDADQRDRPASVVSVSEMVAIGEDRLLVLEKLDRTSRIFAVTLDEDSLVSRLFDSADYGPGLEWLDAQRLGQRGLKPLEKELVLDTDTPTGLPARIEGLAQLSPTELIIINDNDFGVDGVRTQLFRVTLPQPIR